MDQRNVKRTTWYSNAYKQTQNDFSESIGIVSNISDMGMSIIGDFSEPVDTTMCVRIKLPEGLNCTPLELELKEVWRTDYKDKNYFNQAGYRFENLKEDQKRKLSLLIEFIEKQKYAYIY
ncbi:MAG: hypothetical protein IEMM0008_0843 [bacterium]|nr:MAG: hypothetical protein IEMM0008_0843 [bacterium]